MKFYISEATSARTAYDSLSDTAKKDVKNLDKLTKVEAKTKFYTEIDDAKAKLAALKKDSSESAARAAYEA